MFFVNINVTAICISKLSISF